MRPTKASWFIRAAASVLCLWRFAWRFISPSLLQWKYDTALIEFISTVRAARGSSALRWEERDSGWIFERCESQINFFTRAFNVGKQHTAPTCVVESICLWVFRAQRKSFLWCDWCHVARGLNFLSSLPSSVFFSCSNLDFFTKLFYILLGCLLLFAHTSTDLSDGRVCLPVEGCMLRHGSRLCLQGLSVNVFPCFFVHMHVRLWELAYPCSPSCVHASVCVWKTAAAVGVLAAGWVKRRGQLSLWNMLVLISVTRPNRVMNQHKAWDSPDWSTAFSTNTCASLRLHLLPL